MTGLKRLITPMLMISTLMFSSCALSHQTSTGYLTAELNNSGTLNGELQIRLFDLERVIGATCKLITMAFLITTMSINCC